MLSNKNNKRWTIVLFLISVMGASYVEAQEPTRIQIRVTANDAKIIGSGVGGVAITVRDTRTGDILAEGVQEGSTGNTAQIMGSQQRGGPVFEADGAGGFMAEIHITEPTPVEISARGPLGTDQAIQTASKSLLVIPGRDVLGEGVIIELNGFTVEIMSPVAGSVEAGAPFEVRARITMLCGCPTEPGGMWDSTDYEILARLTVGSEVVGEWPLVFAGSTSEYTGTALIETAGDFVLHVIASDQKKANFGMASLKAVAVSPPRSDPRPHPGETPVPGSS